jgi:hypothetical protein
MMGEVEVEVVTWELGGGLGSGGAVGHSREARTTPEPSYCGCQISTQQKSSVGLHKCVL